MDSLKESLPKKPDWMGEEEYKRRVMENDPEIPDPMLNSDIADTATPEKLRELASVPAEVIDNTGDPINIDGEQRPPSLEGIANHVKEDAIAFKEDMTTVAKSAGTRIAKFAEESGRVIGNGLEEGVESLKGVTKEYPNFWVGAAPVLMGALLGDIGAGAQAGSEGLMQRYKDERDAGKASRKAASTSKKDSQAKRGSFQYKPIERADGSIGYLKVDTRTGEETLTDYTTGYKRSITKNPTTGELASISGSTASARPVFSSGKKYTVKQEKDISRFRDSVLDDKVFNKNRETVSSTGRALSLLKANNPISDAGIKTIFPRMFGEVGNLAAAEQERFSGSPSIPRKLEALKEKYTKGTLSDDDRRDLSIVAKVMEEYSRKQLENTADAFINSEKRYRGYSAREILDPFLGGKESVKDTGAPAINAKRDVEEEAINNPANLPEYARDEEGNIVKLNPKTNRYERD